MMQKIMGLVGAKNKKTELRQTNWIGFCLRVLITFKIVSFQWRVDMLFVWRKLTSGLINRKVNLKSLGLNCLLQTFFDLLTSTLILSYARLSSKKKPVLFCMKWIWIKHGPRYQSKHYACFLLGCRVIKSCLFFCCYNVFFFGLVD